MVENNMKAYRLVNSNIYHISFALQLVNENISRDYKTIFQIF